MNNLQPTDACLHRYSRAVGRSEHGRWASALAALTLAVLCLSSAVARAELVVSSRQKIVAGDPTDNKVFGSAVTIDGDTAVIGAPIDANGAGAIYIFVRNALGVWQPHPTSAKIIGTGVAAGDSFGTSVSLSGQSLVVGAPGRANASGTVYAFRRAGTAGTTAWTQEQVITPSGLVAQDDFGGVLSFSVDTMVVGARGDTSSSGAAYAYLRGATTPPWTLQTKLLPTTRVQGGVFGFSVAVFGGVAVVGAPGQTDPGAAFVYRRTGANWALAASLTVAAPVQAPVAGDAFGTAVAIGSNWLLVGAPETQVGLLPEVGAAYFFAPNGLGWVAQQRINSPSPGDSGEFGQSVALLGSRAVIGAPAESAGFGQGHLYELSTSWQPARTSLTTGLIGFVGFGATVALSADSAIGGSTDEPCDEDGLNCAEQGSAYVFALASTAAPVPALDLRSKLALLVALGTAGAWLLRQRRLSAPMI